MEIEYFVKEYNAKMGCPFCFGYHQGGCKKDDRRLQMLVRMEAQSRQERIDGARAYARSNPCKGWVKKTLSHLFKEKQKDLELTEWF